MDAGRIEVGGIEALHLARSRVIDAHAKVDAAICRRLRANQIELDTWQVSQKAEALRTIKASPRYSKLERQRVHDLLARFDLLNEIRCDLAHSPLRVVRIDDQLTALFANPKNADGLSSLARLMNAEQLSAVASELEDMAKALA